uniref:Lysosome-associated membrane glycoprotein 2-like luminal domain-containing protein n=1 Tax=Salvator merianae TaxID=96440 RepID=A0A8D0DWD8_SALMN
MEWPRSRTGRRWSPLSCGLLPLALLLLHGSVLFQIRATEVELKEDSKTCLYVNWIMNFSVVYETESNEYKKMDFALPDNVSYSGSDCGDDYGSILAIEFGDSNYWNLSFTKSGDTYQGTISFTYNTDDTQLFPDAKRIGPVTIATPYPAQPVQLNTMYTCNNLNFLQTDNVTQYIWNVSLQAFVQDGFLSAEKTHCSQDVPAVLEQVVSTTTTSKPVPAPTPVPSTTVQPWAKPAAGTYSIKYNGTVCLLATMALQLNISEKVDAVLLNINPNNTKVNGTCGNTTSFLSLKDGNKEITFGFAIKNTTFEVFYLKEVKITVVDATNHTHTVANGNLSSWEATMGSSYMCQKETVLEVTPYSKINVLNLQIQPFDVRDNQFSTAEECYTSEFLYLIPIIVGAVLGLLLIFIFIYYMYRRRKNQNGYKSV